eukprot:5324753-Pleurochrysis_carterae.AAC.3
MTQPCRWPGVSWDGMAPREATHVAQTPRASIRAVRAQAFGRLGGWNRAALGGGLRSWAKSSREDGCCKRLRGGAAALSTQTLKSRA